MARGERVVERQSPLFGQYCFKLLPRPLSWSQLWTWMLFGFGPPPQRLSIGLVWAMFSAQYSKRPQVWNVLGWMFKWWLAGVWPTTRHDNTSLAASRYRGDQWRASRAGKPMPIPRGGLIDYRGDWSWYKQVFGITGWRGGPPTARICYRCACTVAQMGEFGMNASWRPTIYTPTSYLEELRTGRLSLDTGPLVVPGFTWVYLRPGLMHVGCLGSTQEAVGNALWEVFVSLGGTMTSPNQAFGWARLEGGRTRRGKVGGRGGGGG